MASSQTNNYGLNQWSEEDRVLRQEFNQDNAKTDIALESLEALAEEIREACPLVKLKDFTVSTSQAEVDFDVSGIDFTQYLELLLYFEPSTVTTAKVVYLAVNHEEKYYYNNSTTEALAETNVNSQVPTESFCRFRITLCGCLSGEGTYAHLNGSNPNTGTWGPYMCPVKDSQLKSIQLWAYQTVIGADSRIRLYGIKK